MERVYLKCLCLVNFASAVKRLMKEAAELKDPTDHYHAQPLEVSLGVMLIPEQTVGCFQSSRCTIHPPA